MRALLLLSSMMAISAAPAADRRALWGSYDWSYDSYNSYDWTYDWWSYDSYDTYDWWSYDYDAVADSPTAPPSPPPPNAPESDFVEEVIVPTAKDAILAVVRNSTCFITIEDILFGGDLQNCSAYISAGGNMSDCSESCHAVAESASAFADLPYCPFASMEELQPIWATLAGINAACNLAESLGNAQAAAEALLSLYSDIMADPEEWFLNATTVFMETYVIPPIEAAVDQIVTNVTKAAEAKATEVEAAVSDAMEEALPFGGESVPYLLDALGV
jgi:hypothetical protein